MWSKMDTDLPDITRINEPKWRAYLSGCQEVPNDFGLLKVQEFLRYGNIPIVTTPNLEIMSGGLSEGAPLVHFLCRTPRRSFLSWTCFFPPKKPMMSAGRWCMCP